MTPRLVKANLPHLPCLTCYEVLVDGVSKGYVVKRSWRKSKGVYWSSLAGRYGSVRAPFTTRVEALDALLGGS